MVDRKDNKKIGIATFHCAENYGAYLQAFALQKWLQKRFEPEKKVKIINYRPAYLILPYRIKLGDRIEKGRTIIQKSKACITFMTEVPYRLIRKKHFKQAARLLSLTKPIFSDEFVLDESYVALILGSDQIWNTNLTKGVDRVYFGEVAPHACRKISYAASIGMEEFPPEIKSKVETHLSNLDSIGVRERDSVKILHKLCRHNIAVNVDPTLLIDPDFWKDYLSKVKYSDYILVYRVGSDMRMMEDAYKIAKRRGKIILHFGDPSIKPIFPDVIVKSLAYCGPFEFISYISNAEVVLTDSFHATCFSLIFNRRFYTYLQLSRSERLKSLSNIGQFNERLVEYGKSLDEEQIEQIFAQPVEKYIEKFVQIRKKSEDYLIKSLEGIHNGTI